ncbi:hypothetical protein MKEN_00394500 [Mycena kentingensis (nom. inval.)]|nr:hypothetical protein MKEN_00394500 [Mycena kentingensis (nom. inval.)]
MNTLGRQNVNPRVTRSSQPSYKAALRRSPSLPLLPPAAMHLLLRSLVLLPLTLALQVQQPLVPAVELVADKCGYTDCSSPDSIVYLDSLTVSPDPPRPGQDLTILATGTVRPGYVIEDGAYADVLVKLGLIKLLQKTFDVCEEARNANVSVQCPVSEGTYSVKQVVKLPKEIPPAKFTVVVNAFTKDDDDVLCLKLDADFRP